MDIPRAEYYLLPIDECYKLVGLIRMHWKGLSGGTEVWRELGEFFASLKADRSKSRESRSREEDPMPDLTFQVEGVEVVANAATPLLAFKLRLTDANPEQTFTRSRCAARSSSKSPAANTVPEDQEQPAGSVRRAQSLGPDSAKSFVDARQSGGAVVQGSTLVDLPVPCTFDFNVAATKYFDGLADGEVPVCLQFSGTVFYASGEGGLQVAPIAWDKEARFKLPVKIWRDMMDPTIPTAPGCACTKMPLTACIDTKCGTAFPPGKRRWRGSFRWKRR